MKVIGSRRRLAVVLAAAGLAPALAFGPAPAGAAPPEERRYIVVLRDGADEAGAVAEEHRRDHGAEVRHVYRSALKGYAATFRGNAASAAARDHRVAYIEPDGEVTASAQQVNPPWGLDRIDQLTPVLDQRFNYTNTGAGVTAYIIDTGIRLSHADLGGRAVSGFDAIDGGSADDCHGHGTHVAGTVGGTTFGVAKDVRLVAVRVLNCQGSATNSQVIAGIEWVTANAVRPAVANMSLGGTGSAAVDTAVRNSIVSGVSYAVAAGNEGASACSYSPARLPEAMTVSATDKNDARPSFANYGNCVDWFAPGVGITSAWATDDRATRTISGTSMAAPHTAGVAALYLQSNPAAPPAEVRDALFAGSVKGKVRSTTTFLLFTSGRTVNNHMLFTNY